MSAINTGDSPAKELREMVKCNRRTFARDENEYWREKRAENKVKHVFCRPFVAIITFVSRTFSLALRTGKGEKEEYLVCRTENVNIMLSAELGLLFVLHFRFLIP